MIFKIKSYFFSFILLLSVLSGGCTGYTLESKSICLKPLADIFINLLFTTLTPLVFFCISATVARIGKSKQLWKITSNMFLTFIFTSVIAGIFMLIVVKLFPPGQNVLLQLPKTVHPTHINLADQFVHMFSINEIGKLFSHEHILALMCFSILIGLGTSSLGEKGKIFSVFLQSGSEVFMKITSYIMYFAPLGFFAYSAIIIGELGPKLLNNYFHITVIYYTAGIIYFIFGFTFFSYLAGKIHGVKIFWKNIFVPATTSLATCSSSASMPANLQAAKNMGISPTIYETVIPFGAMLHKDGSVLGGVIKIAFLFGIFHMSFAGGFVLVTAVFISMLVGVVMGAIPSGGMLGELLILSVYGFPSEVLLLIATISIIIDPLATMLNVTGDLTCSLMVENLIKKPESSAISFAIENPEGS